MYKCVFRKSDGNYLFVKDNHINEHILLFYHLGVKTRLGIIALADDIAEVLFIILLKVFSVAVFTLFLLCSFR